MEPAAAYLFMGFKDPSVVDAAQALDRFKELRKVGEYREEPKKTQLLEA